MVTSTVSSVVRRAAGKKLPCNVLQVQVPAPGTHCAYIRHRDETKEFDNIPILSNLRCSHKFHSVHLNCIETKTMRASTVERVERVLAAKAASGLSYDDLASKLGVTNAYCAQLLLGQAKLRKDTAAKLSAALPAITAADLESMQNDFPMRTFNDEILKEPNVYRTYEAVTHYGEAIKTIINEQCGDGIMSAIDFYVDVGTVIGKNGEKRVVITFNGKFLEHIEQKTENNTACSPRA
jgi:cyanate lyase